MIRFQMRFAHLDPIRQWDQLCWSSQGVIAGLPTSGATTRQGRSGIFSFQ